MRKRLCLSILILFTSLVALDVRAQIGGPELRIGTSCPQDGVSRGNMITVPVNFMSRGNTVASMGFTVLFDPLAFALVNGIDDVQAGPVLDSTKFDKTVQVGAGTIRVLITPKIQLPIPEIPNGPVCKISLTAQEDGPLGCSSLQFRNVEFGDTLGHDVPPGPSQEGGVEILQCIQGDADRDQTITEDDIISTSLCIFHQLTETECGCGDCNADLERTSADVTCTILCIFDACPVL